MKNFSIYKTSKNVIMKIFLFHSKCFFLPQVFVCFESGIITLCLTLFLFKRVSFFVWNFKKRVVFGFAVVGSAPIKWFEQAYVHLLGWKFSLLLTITFIYCSHFPESLVKRCHFIIPLRSLFVTLFGYLVVIATASNAVSIVFFP